MDQSRDHSVWRPPAAVLEQQGGAPARPLWRSAVVGVLVSSCTLMALGGLAVFLVLLAARSNGVRLSAAGVEFLPRSVPIFWSLALLAGGFAAAWSTGPRWPVASLVVAPPFVLVWIVVAALTVGAPTSGHVFAVVVSIPAAMAGGFIASRVAG